MQKISRAQFLEKHWQAYPRVGSGILSCREVADSAEPFWLGGRISALTQSSLTLTSDGRRVLVNSAAQTTMIFTWPGDAQVMPSMSFDHDWLRLGDLLCAECRWDQQKQLILEKVLLLVPAGPATDPLEFTVERSQQWAKFTSVIRDFFTQNGFIEAQTPTLVTSPGTEPYLEAFHTNWQNGSDVKELFLPTSPEFHLKKMLVAGWTKIFEIKSCFRNGELSSHHQAEFLMLEWYRAFANLEQIATDVANLLQFIQTGFLGSSAELKVAEVTMAQLFQKYLNFSLTPATTAVELQMLCRQKHTDFSANDSWDDLFFRLFLEHIEKHLGQEQPLIVRNYPPSQAALSRLTKEGWADRFEVYWRGLEMANAFHELNDPEENQRRFLSDQTTKIALGRKPFPAEKELLAALRYGLPPSGGIALGVDRLFMAFCEIKNISETRAFPMKPEEKPEEKPD